MEAAVVGVEVAVAPLIARSGRRFLCFPGVVAYNLDDVFTWLKTIGDVETESHDTVVAVAERPAIEQHFGCLARTLKLDENLFPDGRLRQFEALHIADLSGGHLRDRHPVCVILIPGMRQSDPLRPKGFQRVSDGVVDDPVGVEIIGFPRLRKKRQCKSRNQCDKSDWLRIHSQILVKVILSVDSSFSRFHCKAT